MKYFTFIKNKSNNKEKITTKIEIASCPVIYDKQRQEEIATIVILKILTTPSVLNDPDKLLSLLKLLLVMMKNSRFEEENEYRIVFDLIIDKNNNYEFYREKNSIFIPFIKVSSNELLPISTIRVGPKINLDNSVKSINDFLINNNYSSVKFRK